MEQHIIFGDTYMNVIKFGHGSRNLAVIAGVSLTGLENSGEVLENVLSIFSEDFTVYVFDRMKVLTKGYTIEDMADDIYICLQNLGVERTSVYGASQGGMIGQVLAIKHPELVEKLVICSTISRMKYANNEAISSWISASKAHDVEKVNMLFLDYVYSQAFVDSIKDSIPDLIKNGTPTDCDRFAIMLEAINNFDIYDSLDDIKCPTFVLGDENDKVFGSKPSYEIAEKLGCDIYIYNQYSHAVYDEAPDIKSRILDFLK